MIIDYGNRCVVVLDCEFRLLRVIGQGDDDHSRRLVNPVSIAVTDNAIAVSDYGSHQVKKYSLRGHFLSTIGCFGKNFNQFHTPKGLVFGSNKLLYVVD